MSHIRRLFFWSHLALGLAAGSIILIMSATGALLALQPHLLAWLERDVRRAPATSERLPVSALIAAASAASGGAAPASIVLDADASHTAQVAFGRQPADGVTQLLKLGFGQIAHAQIRVNAGIRQQFFAGRAANTIDVS